MSLPTEVSVVEKGVYQQRVTGSTYGHRGTSANDAEADDTPGDRWCRYLMTTIDDIPSPASSIDQFLWATNRLHSILES